MSFKDFQYSFGKFKTNVEGQIVRHIPYKNQDIKQLSVWIFRERNDLSSLKTLAYQHSETNKALLNWINDEVDCPDLKDLVGDKIVKLLDKQVEIEQEYADKIQLYRQAIKSIRVREEQVSGLREHKKALQSRLQQLESSNKKSKKRVIDKIVDVTSQLESAEHETKLAEQDLIEFKHIALREAFYLRFNALAEYTEKAAMIAGFGKYMADLLVFDQVGNQSYNEKVASTILSDAMQALDHWVPTQSDERTTLTGNPQKKNENEDDEKKKKKKKKNNDNENNDSNNKKLKGKNKENKEEEEEEIEEEEEPLTPPELPPRLALNDPYYHQHVSETPSSSSSSFNHINHSYYNYQSRGYSSSSMDSKEEIKSYQQQEAPPPSYYSANQTSLNEIHSNTIPSPVRLEIQTKEENDDDDDNDELTDHHHKNSGPSYFTYYPVEQLHQQIQMNNKKSNNNKRTYMEFSQQYTHRQQGTVYSTTHLTTTHRPSIAPPLPPPRSRSVMTLPLSLSAPSAPSAPTADEIHFLPIPSAPPPSEF